MIEDSIKDTEIIGKTIGIKIKSYIKDNSKKYFLDAKDKIILEMREYRNKLKEKEEEEFMIQENEELKKHQSIEKLKEKNIILNNKIDKNRIILEKIIERQIRYLKKYNCFSQLKIEKSISHNQKNKENQILYFLIKNIKRKAFNNIMRSTLQKPTIDYENEVKRRFDEKIKDLKKSYKFEKEEILELIYKAQENLKNEIKKKIQTKLLLDQIVLKGVSAMNIQALTLSNETLKDIYKNDNLKEYEKNFITNLPKTKFILSQNDIKIN